MLRYFYKDPTITNKHKKTMGWKVSSAHGGGFILTTHGVGGSPLEMGTLVLWASAKGGVSKITIPFIRRASPLKSIARLWQSTV
jgi:hypothetical protein